MARISRDQLLERITYNPDILGGKPTIRGRRLAVEHVLGMLAAGDSPETILEGYAWMEREGVRNPARLTAVIVPGFGGAKARAA